MMPLPKTSMIMHVIIEQHLAPQLSYAPLKTIVFNSCTYLLKFDSFTNILKLAGTS